MEDKLKINLGINKPFVLNDPKSFWMVVDGAVDIFYVTIDSRGTYRSPLSYLYSAKKGEILFGLLNDKITEGIQIIATSSNARLMQLNKNNLMDIDHSFLKFHINKWICKLSKQIFKDPVPRIYCPLTYSEEIELKKDEVSFPPKDLVWCRIISGDLGIFGGTYVKSDNETYSLPFPVNTNLWLQAASKTAIIKTLSPYEVLNDELFFMLALDEIQSQFYKRIQENENKKKESTRLRLELKLTSEKSRVDKTIRSLGNVIKTLKGKRTNSQTPDLEDRSDVLKICRFIGDEVGFSFSAPKFLDSYNDSLHNQLFAIGQASNVRVRKIILRGVWWKEENGHLLAFTREGKKPVALIQKSATTYVLKTTENDEVTVTNEIAESLEPIAFMFFFAFDSKMDSVKKIVGFALQGVQKDGKSLLLAALSGSLIGLLVPVLSGIMFDDVIPTADREILWEVFGLMLIIGGVTALLQLIQGVLQLRVETKSNLNLQGGLMDHLLRLPVTFYKRFTAGDLTNRALSINAIRQIVSNTVMTAALSGAFSMVNLVLLFYYESKLAWIGVGLAVFAILFVSLIGWLKLKYDRVISDDQGDIQGFLFEFLSGITKIRVTGAESRIFSIWAEKFSKLKRMAFRSGSYQNVMEVFNGSYPLMTKIFFFAFIYYLYTTSSSGTALISVGAFMAFISAFNQFLGDTLKMSLSLISSLHVVTLYERVKPILDEEPESVEDSIDPGELSGGIELNSISFRYNEDQPLVLKDISLKIEQGEMVAFIGPSGSGKSTIMRILLGFEEPEAGSVYYDGDAFDSMNKDLVRRQIGVVLQNGALMSGSIYKNIVGNSELSLDDAWEAARMAGMEEDIKQMPMEMHTVVSEGAGTFSGGQRQRLMIARAIAHKPRLLFMDEATSALDNKTQQIVSESLDNLQATRIVIAHRLSTIKNADRIFVLDKGSIVESGTYEELMSSNGLFTKLAQRQLA